VSKHGATKTTPFELVFGQEVMLPVKENLQAVSVARQNTLTVEDYESMMMDKLDEALEVQYRAMREIEKGKLQTVRAYNKKVKEKSFQVGDLVWKTILSIGTRDNRFGKWSPS
jgi:hypothetical protein